MLGSGKVGLHATKLLAVVSVKVPDGALVALALQEQTVACGIHIDVFGFCGGGGSACYLHAHLTASLAVACTDREPTEAVRRYRQAHLRLRYRQRPCPHFHELAYAVQGEANHAVGADGLRRLFLPCLRHALSM